MSIRARITAWYAVVFAGSALLLLAAGYWIVERNVPTDPTAIELRLAERPAGGPSAGEVERVPRASAVAQSDINEDALRDTLWQFALTLLVATGLAVVAGSLVAGRALRPIREIARTAERVSHDRLGERIALAGPRDELRELADLIDGMLDRLDRAFAAQRHFAAQAAHELRTPLTLLKTEVDVALGDEEEWSERQREVFDAISRSVARGEAVVERLLVLARGQQERLAFAPVALDELVREAVQRRAAGPEIALEVDLRPAVVSGDRVLLGQAIDNLVENAVAHNRAGGWVRVACRVDDAGAAVVVVENTGPPIAAQDVERLVEPFERLDGRGDGGAGEGGVGLGLSIVKAVIDAHRGTLHLRPGRDGGLRVRMRFDDRPRAALPGPPRAASTTDPAAR